MLRSEILRRVRVVMDESESNLGALTDGNDSLNLDESILACLGDALCYVARNAPLNYLGGSDETTATGMIVDGSSFSTTNGGVDLPDNFVRLRRVRMKDWHRAVIIPVLEDSEEYLELTDETESPLADRPKAALVYTSPMRLELYPCTQNLQLQMVCLPTNSLTAIKNNATNIPLPPLLVDALMWLTAWLVLTGYRDADAQRMLDTGMRLLRGKKIIDN